MASTRAREVAEVLWELKRADKVATYTAIANRAGFSAGTNGRTMQSCLKTVRRDWAHLQWWRAISDDGLIPKNSEHEVKLRESGFELEPASGKNKGDVLTLAALEEHLMSWEETGATAE
jgi:alkylated DNA nucleotide flippase Atl1